MQFPIPVDPDSFAFSTDWAALSLCVCAYVCVKMLFTYSMTTWYNCSWEPEVWDKEKVL